MTRSCRVITTAFVPRATREHTAIIGRPAGYFDHARHDPDEEAVPGLVELNVETERSVAIEHGKKGLRANAIAPAAVSPGMLGWLKTLPGGVEGFASALPMGRLGTPEDIASVAAFLASEHAGFVDGVVLPVDGGVDAMLAVPA